MVHLFRIISLLYSLFAHNIGQYYLIFLRNNFFPYFLPCSICFISSSVHETLTTYLSIFSLKESCEILWNSLKDKGKLSTVSILKSVSSFASNTWSNLTTSYSISSFSLHLDLNSCNEKNPLEGKHFWRKTVSSLCSYYHYQEIYHLVHGDHNNYSLAQLLRWIVTKSIFLQGFYQ